MKKETIIGIMSDFLDSIRAYEHESGEAIHFDERESSEFVDMYFNNAKQEGIELTEKLINIIMKKYRLKKWYPSLPKNNKNKETLKEGSIVEMYKDDSNSFYFLFFDCCLNKLGFHYLSEEEISSDFWELIEEEKPKPLFITDDGVEINKNYGGWLYRISKDFKREVLPISPEMEVEGYKVFAHPENADKYIEEHKPKPLFTTEDGVEVFEGDKTIPVDVRTWEKYFAEENCGLDEHFKYFFHESNADEYIWKNKRVFSYEDIIEHAYNNPKYRIFIEKLAKERSEE